MKSRVGGVQLVSEATEGQWGVTDQSSSNKNEVQRSKNLIRAPTGILGGAEG